VSKLQILFAARPRKKKKKEKKINIVTSSLPEIYKLGWLLGQVGDSFFIFIFFTFYCVYNPSSNTNPCVTGTILLLPPKNATQFYLKSQPLLLSSTGIFSCLKKK